jgi:hypothetical protein
MFGKNDIPKSINFMNPVTRPDDIWANAYNWMFEVGKYMLIVVEVLALGVFISRFILDEQSNDLTRDINDQVLILSGGNWQQDSITYENIQNLLVDVSRVEKEQKINSIIINEVRNGIPNGLSVETFTFSNGRVGLNLKTTNFQAFKDYETAIKNNADYENVSFSATKEGTIYDIQVNFNVGEIDG